MEEVLHKNVKILKQNLYLLLYTYEVLVHNEHEKDFGMLVVTTTEVGNVHCFCLLVIISRFSSHSPS